MKSKKSIVGVVLGLLLFVFAIFIIITNGKDIKTLNEALYSLKAYSSYYGSSYSSNLETIANLGKAAGILIIIGGAILILFQIINLGLFVAENDEVQSKVIISGVCIYLVLEITAIICTMSAVSRGGESVPGRIIACLICDFIMLCALIGCAIKLNDSSIDNSSKVLGVLVGIIMVAVSIILYLIDSPSTLNTLSGVFYLISGICFCIYICMPSFSYHQLGVQAAARRAAQSRTSTNGDNDELRPLFTQTSAPASTPKPQQKSQNPVEALKELKVLLDSGIITQEEYNEKRKKYIDML